MKPKATIESQKPFSPNPGVVGQIFKDIRYAGKLIILAFVGVSLVWIFTLGQPSLLLEAVVQGFNCGVTSEVADAWTCDKAPDEEVISP